MDQVMAEWVDKPDAIYRKVVAGRVRARLAPTLRGRCLMLALNPTVAPTVARAVR